jgi:hypothetical protein
LFFQLGHEDELADRPAESWRDDDGGDKRDKCGEAATGRFSSNFLFDAFVFVGSSGCACRRRGRSVAGMSGIRGFGGFGRFCGHDRRVG